MWHPSALLLAWMSYALALQWMPVAWVIFLALLCLLVSELFARNRSHRLLVRARWLLLSLMVLFIFLTPGEYLPGVPGSLGMTHEGLLAAGEHCGRLIAMLASLALLHECIGTQGLLAGLYCLMGPCKWRRMTVVRLMLVLECAEQKQVASWRDWLKEGDAPHELTACQLEISSMQVRDWMLVVVLGVLLCGMVILR